jgi:2-polyprenyl-6-methoxyphenol hydroxylase-like FAD-dependent oxidoreductase
MDRRPVLVAGGGIGGLCVALTLHQIGVPCLVLESVRHLQPLGVGINMQPNAVRELYELGIGPDHLDAIGLQTREFADPDAADRRMARPLWPLWIIGSGNTDRVWTYSDSSK